MRVLLGITAVLLVLAAIAVGWLLTTGYYALDGARLAAVVLGLTGLLCVGFIARSRHSAAVATLAIGMIVFNYLFVGWVLPSAERLKPVPALAAAFNARASAKAQAGHYSYSLPSFGYYINRTVDDISSIDHATAFFAENHESYAMMLTSTFDALRATGLRLCVAARHPAFTFDAPLTRDADGRLRRGRLLTGQPPEDVLLVTNQCGG